MRLGDLLAETWHAIAANKGRSLLTVLGIVIGIAAVITMTSLIGGMQQSLVSNLGLDQARAVYIDYWADRESTLGDIEAIQENVDGYEFIAGMQYGYGTVSNGREQQETTVLGVGAGYFRTMGVSMVEGRMLTDRELAGDGMLVMLDRTLAEKLFGHDAQAAGEQVTIGDDAYTVVGVLESAGMMFGGNGTAYVPFNTCATRITGWARPDSIVGFAREDADMEALVAQTESFLYGYLGLEPDSDYGYVSVYSVAQAQAELSSAMGTFSLLASAVAGISLLVGGIGIMNMMLTNVTERIREIGLRKALGARRADITRQFLLESIAICLVGGVIGVAAGLGGAFLVAGLASDALGQELMGESMQITPVLSPETALLAAGICVGIGVVFGFWPARRAARLDPVEALRYQ